MFSLHQPESNKHFYNDKLLLLIVETENKVSEPSKKRIKHQCIIHCTSDNGELVSPKDLESWRTLLKAAQIRKYEPILNITCETSINVEIPPDVFYHRKCRSIFTMKRELDKICAEEPEELESSAIPAGKRTSQRERSSSGITYEES